MSKECLKLTKLVSAARVQTCKRPRLVLPTKHRTSRPSSNSTPLSMISLLHRLGAPAPIRTATSQGDSTTGTRAGCPSSSSISSSKSSSMGPSKSARGFDGGKESNASHALARGGRFFREGWRSGAYLYVFCRRNFTVSGTGTASNARERR